MKALHLTVGAFCLLLATTLHAQSPDRILWPPAPRQTPFGMPGFPPSMPLNDYYSGQLIGAATPRLPMPTTTTCWTVGNLTTCETR